MEYEYEQTPLSRSIGAGVLAGIGVSLANLAFDYAYRDLSKFSMASIFNVSSIIFGTMILFTVASLVYYALAHFVPGGRAVYMILFGLLTVLCFWIGLHVNRSADPEANHQFRTLFLGIELISGMTVVFLVPYLVRNSSIYS